MSEALPNLAAVVNEVTGNWSPTGHLLGGEGRRGWGDLRSLVSAQAPTLSAPVPVAFRTPDMPRLCLVCSGPAGRGSQRCYQCALHAQCADGSLADVVVPVTYALKGSAHARRLWLYKNPPRPPGIGGPKAAARADATSAGGVSAGAMSAEAAPVAALSMVALLLVFLRDHGGCLWRGAGWQARPTHLAVVPSARARPGPHPLRTLIAPYLRLPWAELSAEPDDERLRELDPDRFKSGPVPASRVLLLDDTWTTGSSAQSAAMALRRAGARSVVTVVIGRHISSPSADLASFGPAVLPFCPASCAVHVGR